MFKENNLAKVSFLKLLIKLLSKINVYSNNFQKTFQAKNPCDCNQIRSNHRVGSVNALNYFLLLINQRIIKKTYQNYQISKITIISSKAILQIDINEQKWEASLANGKRSQQVCPMAPFLLLYFSTFSSTTSLFLLKLLMQICR